ncbi:arylsulfatase [Anaerorhabdus sp.]|uniref:arylsulfatase n=1 Tax=Anaerorhabdus sp. TaxID=1872524 RepID=UPI002FC5BFDD
MKKSNKPNIVVFMSDQFRGDCLSILNHPDVKTPYLDTLAAEGQLFENAYSACPTCIPARAIMFTGKSQRKTKRVGYEECIDWNYEHMLAEELSNAGYQTQCVGKMHVHPPRLSCGFQNVKLHDGYIGHYRRYNTPYWQHQNVCDDYMYFLKSHLGPSADVNESGAENNSWITAPWPYEDRYHPTNWVVDESIRFLETRDRTKPFFLMSSFVRPHPPFDAPKAYLDMYINKDLKMPEVGDWVNKERTEKNGYIMDSADGCNDEELKHQALAGYYACITHLDHQIGRLITALENDESYNNTIILFISDHGELLFDNNTFRKTLPYQGSINIPCIFHIGKDLAKTTPFVSDNLFELKDVMPTLLDFADIPIPLDVDGISFKKKILTKEEINRTYIHGEHTGSPYIANQYIVTKKDKFIWFTQRNEEQYFDLEHDPKELHNLIHDPKVQTRITELRNILIKELADREEGYSDGKKLIPHQPMIHYLQNKY